MDTLCYALLAGYPVMGGAIAVLFRLLQKAQGTQLEQAQNHERTLEELRAMMRKRISDDENA